MVAADAHDVASLLRESFDQELHPYIVYCQPGLAAYLDVVLTAQHLFPDHALWVAESEVGLPVAFAEFRSTPGRRALLSYICVAAERRGQGLASALLAGFLDSGPDVGHVDLDVFAHNAVAQSLYRRLGFKPVGASTWWVRSIEERTTSGATLRLLDVPAVVASLERYGFCRLQSLYGDSVVDLGLTSRSVLRLSDVTQMRNPALQSRVRELLPDVREALAVLPDSAALADVASPLLRSLRLTVPAAILASALAR